MLLEATGDGAIRLVALRSLRDGLATLRGRVREARSACALLYSLG